MKVSTLTSSLFGLVVLYASNVLANSEYFRYPAPESTFSPGESIQFLALDTPDFDNHATVEAELFSENGDFVTRIRSFFGEQEDDNLRFSWRVNSKIIPGKYYVQLRSSRDYKDITRSHTFNIEDEVYDHRYSDYYGYRD